MSTRNNNKAINRVITDPREWRHYKMLNEVYTSVEENMFTKTNQDGRPEVYLRPKESVNIPFKFLTFRTDTSPMSSEPVNPTDPYRTLSGQLTKTAPQTRSELSRVIKVWFKTKEDKPISILSIRVEHQPHIINQTFRLNHPEQTFLKKSIRLPPLHTIIDQPTDSEPVGQVFVRCSDPNVICDSKKVRPGEPHDIYIKVACGASPQVKKFQIAAYIDPYLSKPIQIWQMYIHAMNRVDAAATAGQTSRFALIVRGTQSSRLIQCFSSHPDELVIEPRDAFMLPANSLQEIAVGVRPMHVGTKHMHINVVDIEFHQLVRSWLVSVISQSPVVNKTFQLRLPVGGGAGSNQRISFTNPYGARRLFVVRTNREDVLTVREPKLDLAAGEVANIRLSFAPRMTAGCVDILVFINDEDDKNEETFRVNAVYRS